jgi:hypothetical protein
MPTCRPGSSVLDGLQPGRQAQHGESGKGHIHIAASSVKPLRARSTPAIRDWDLAIAPGPRAGTSPCHCPIADPHDSLVPCTTQTVHRGTVNVGTWNVRGLKSAESTFTNLWT